MSTRTLVILRHAKAGSPDGQHDRERPLSDRGHADAAEVGTWLRANGYFPRLVLCSPAKRTCQTWDEVAKARPGQVEVRYEDRLYTATVSDLLDAVREVADPVTTVLLIGHNPTVSEFTAILDPASFDSTSFDRTNANHTKSIELRTSGLAIHQMSGPWAQIGPGGAARIAEHTGRG